MRASYEGESALLPLVGLTVPPGVQAACERRDLAFLLRWWSLVAAPIPDEEFQPAHPLFGAVCLVASTLEQEGESRMTSRQRLASLGRMGHGLRGQWLLA